MESKFSSPLSFQVKYSITLKFMIIAVRYEANAETMKLVKYAVALSCQFLNVNLVPRWWIPLAEIVLESPREEKTPISH